jgi:dTDP-4-dehydrorhamnose 3,5-epimerase
MRVRETTLPGVLVVEPLVFRDGRGFFLETWHARRFAEAGLGETFVQDNHSRSLRGTLRGLHWQWRHPQAKLIRVTTGEVFDVAVDVRPESPSFGLWTATYLSGDNLRQLFVPRGFAHGFCVLSDEAHVEYKCSDYYDAEGERGVRWDDPDLAIPWPVNAPLLSARDREHPMLRELFGRGPAEGGGPAAQRITR